MGASTVRLEFRDRVAELTLERPEKLNAIDAALSRDLLAAFAEIERSPARAIVLTGAGRGFSSGADLTAGTFPAHLAGPPLGDAVATSMEAIFNPLMRAMRRLPVPIVAAVNGVAAGGGAALALAADIVIAARSASFVFVFGPKLGIVPDLGSTWLLPRLVGRARALGLALFGDPLPAETAAEWGLIWRCVADTELKAEAAAAADRLAAMPIDALVATREAMDGAPARRFEEQLDVERECQRQLAAAPDFAAGIADFAARRGGKR
jgi:2-(1,2-epoxy-1,2-dihydrophenyl)acetyl-CoA isomerase